MRTSTTLYILFQVIFFSLANAGELDLLNAHGVRVFAKIPELNSSDLELTLSLTPEARELILEIPNEKPENFDLLKKLDVGDVNQIVLAFGQCWIWFDHVFHGEEYSKEKLNLPELSKIKSSVFLTLLDDSYYHGNCVNGYWLNFRKNTDTYWWWFDAGRSISTNRAKVNVNLHFEHWNKSNTDYGQVMIDDKLVFKGMPGFETCENKFKNIAMSAIRRSEIEKSSFELMNKRLRLLLEENYIFLEDSLRNHPDKLRFVMKIKPGPNFKEEALKSVSYYSKNTLRSEKKDVDQIEILKDKQDTMVQLLVPGSFFSYLDSSTRMKLSVYSDKSKVSEESNESLVSIDYKNLSLSITNSRSSFLYLFVLRQAISAIKSNMPDSTVKALFGNLKSEAEFIFIPSDSSNK